MLVDDHSVNAPVVSVVDVSTKGNIALEKQGDIVALDIAAIEEGYREFSPSNFRYLGSVFFGGAPQVAEDHVAMFKLTEIRLADSLTLPILGGTGSFCYDPGIVLPCTISPASRLLCLVFPLVKCYNCLGGSVVQGLGKTMAWSRGDSGRHIFKGLWLLWYIVNLNNRFRSGLLEIAWCEPLECFNNEQGGTFTVAGYDSSNDNMSYVCFICPTATGQDSCVILAAEIHGCNALDSAFLIRTHTIIQVSVFLYYVPAVAHKHGICSVLKTLYAKFLKTVSSSFVHEGIALCSSLHVHDADCLNSRAALDPILDKGGTPWLLSSNIYGRLNAFAGIILA